MTTHAILLKLCNIISIVIKIINQTHFNTRLFESIKSEVPERMITLRVVIGLFYW